MKQTRFIVAALLLALGSGFVGCSGTSPFGSQPMDAFSTGQGFDNPNRQAYDQLAQAFPNHNVVGPGGSRMPPQSQPTSAKPGWLASLQNTGGAISEALTITPQTIPAPDPTSLANQPGDVGGALNYHAAKVYETDGNIAGAMALYRKSLAMTPGDTRAMIGYARLLDREGNFREAERLYLEVLESEPSNVIALNDLGMIYARQGMFDDALKPISQAIQLQPTNQRYRNNMAIVLIDAGRPVEAFDQLASVHGEATAHYNLGFLLARRNMNVEAAGHLQQALTLNPGLDPARQLLDHLATSMASGQHGAPSVARQTRAYPANASFEPESSAHGSMRPLPPL